MGMRSPRGHNGTRRQLRVSDADKCSDRKRYKWSKKGFFHESTVYDNRLA